MPVSRMHAVRPIRTFSGYICRVTSLNSRTIIHRPTHQEPTTTSPIGQRRNDTWMSANSCSGRSLLLTLEFGSGATDTAQVASAEDIDENAVWETGEKRNQ
jgi:hypothetical protein